MIVRIVKLSFDPNKKDEFIHIFESSKEAISAFEGCTYLSLMKDQDNDHVFFTISNWNSPAHLENYRQSELFKTTWAKTKALFNAKPYAWTLNPLQSLGSWLKK